MSRHTDVWAKALAGVAPGTRFGPNDPRHAIGLARDAEGLLSAGAFVPALELASEAVSVLLDVEHELLPAAVALEAEILIRAEGAAPPFGELAGLDEPSIERIAAEAAHRASRCEGVVAHQMFGALDVFCTSQLGATAPTTIRARAARARTAPDPARRRDVLGSLVDALEQAEAVEPLVDTLLARGLAELECGELDAALATHERAVEHARAATDRASRAKALRYFALLLLDAQRAEEAKQAIETAALEAEAAGDSKEAARIAATNGVVLAHTGWFDAARAALRRADQLLDPDAPERTWIDLHRAALEKGTKPSGEGSHLIGAHARARAEAGR